MDSTSFLRDVIHLRCARWCGERKETRCLSPRSTSGVIERWISIFSLEPERSERWRDRGGN